MKRIIGLARGYTAQRKRVPDFVIIGAMKSGTTSLHRYLHAHRDVFMSKIKEPGLFLSPKKEPDLRGITRFEIRQKAIDDTALLRLMLRGYGGERLFGESTTDYTKFPFRGRHIPERMFQRNPHMKLIYLVRHPLERILSHHRHLLSRQPKVTDPDINKDLGRNVAEYVNISRYYFQLSRYLKYFPSPQIKVIVSEDFMRSPRETLNDVLNFLGLTHHYFEDGDFSVYNRSRVRIAGDLRFDEDIFFGPLGELWEDVAELGNLLGKRLSFWDLSEGTWVR